MTEVPINDLLGHIKYDFIIADENVYKIWHKFLGGNCFCINGGEAAKSLSSVEKLIGEMMIRGVKRTDTIIAIGGGAVLDLAGFAASIYMRGVDWINIPTTLLSMADSCIGGKTGINFGGIKNIAGSFHQPRETIFCYEFLQSLSEREMKNGYAEIIKTALLNEKLFKMMDRADLNQIIMECVKVKNEYVSGDLYDRGKRRFLNLGHTIGHGLESVYGLPHGVCVAKGLELETKILGVTPKSIQEWIYKKTGEIIGDEFKFDIDIDKVVGAMLMDKKNESRISFVCLDGVEKCRMAELSKEELIKRWKSKK